MKRAIRALCLGSALVASQVGAQPQPEGFLCCNMRTDGSWITDINYAEAGKKIIPEHAALTFSFSGLRLLP